MIWSTSSEILYNYTYVKTQFQKLKTKIIQWYMHWEWPNSKVKKEKETERENFLKLMFSSLTFLHVIWSSFSTLYCSSSNIFLLSIILNFKYKFTKYTKTLETHFALEQIFDTDLQMYIKFAGWSVANSFFAFEKCSINFLVYEAWEWRLI